MYEGSEYQHVYDITVKSRERCWLVGNIKGTKYSAVRKPILMLMDLINIE